MQRPPVSPHSHSRRRPLAFARLRTTHDCTLRQLVHSSWDEPSSNNSFPTPTTLPARSITDVSGHALHAAQLADVAARRAADASVSARSAAAYARSLADASSSSPVHSPPSPAVTPPPVSLDRPTPPPLHPNPRRANPRTRGGGGAPHRRSAPPARAVTDLHQDPNAKPSAAYVRRPLELGKIWALDVIAVWHNAIRIELFDLEEIVTSLRFSARDVSMAELRAFFGWFSSFEAFVLSFLKAEEEVLFPWVEQWGRIRGPLCTMKRITSKGYITRSIRDTAACAQLLGINGAVRSRMVLTNPNRRYYDTLNVGIAELQMVDIEGSGGSGSGSGSGSGDGDGGIGGDGRQDSTMMCLKVVDKISEFGGKFAVALEEYFREQENYLPKVISCLYDREDATSAKIERKMLCAIWKSGRKEDCTMIILRAVHQARGGYARGWTHANLRRIERIALPLWRRRYNGARGAVASKFKMRKAYWERAAIALQMNFGAGGRADVGSTEGGALIVGQAKAKLRAKRMEE